MLEDIIIRLEDNFSDYLTDIRENEDKRIANELARIANEKARNEYFEKLIAETKSYSKRIKKTYGTVSESEDTFVLPGEYTDACMLDVFVNGICLNKNEYKVIDHDVVLTKPLDVIGTVVELVVTRTVIITPDEYDNLRGLRGFSAYELAVQNGFGGDIEEWLWSLRGPGGYDRLVTYYKTTSENEKRIKLPYVYTQRHLLDVFVNGFKLNNDEYSVEQVGAEYFLVLAKTLDVVGTAVEIDVIDAYPDNTPECVRSLTQQDIDKWNNKSDFSGNYEDLSNKPSIPAKTSDIVNDAGFITNAVNNLLNYHLKSETYSKEEVNSLISAIKTTDIQKVESLPTQNISTNTIYFVAKENSEDSNVYDEYVYMNGNWELIGDTKVDLTGYTKESWVLGKIADFLTETEVNTLITSALGNYYTKTEIDELIGSKVDSTDMASLKEQVKLQESLIHSEHEEKTANGESITVNDSAEYKAEIGISGNSKQATTSIENGDEYDSPGPEHPSAIETVKDNVNVVACNKNLLSLDNLRVTNYMTRENDLVVLDFTSLTSSTNLWGDTNLFKNLNLKKRKYKIQMEIVEGQLKTQNFGIFNTNNQKFAEASFDNIQKMVFDNSIGGIGIWGVSNQTKCKLRIQIIEENSDEAYVTHAEQSFTMPAQDEMLEDDYFDFEAEEEVHVFEKIVLDGVNYGCEYMFENGRFIAYDFLIGKEVSGIKPPQNWALKEGTIICTHLKNTSSADIYQKYVAGVAVTNAGKAMVKLDDATEETNTWTKETINQYLQELNEAGNPILIYYKLETPTRLAFTDAQKAVAEKIRQAKSYYGTTHVYSTDEISPNFTMRYKASNKIKVETLEKEVAEIKELLSTTATSALLLDNLETDLESEVM